jgi:hypothetical protein
MPKTLHFNTKTIQLVQLSFSPRTHEHCSQEMLEVTRKIYRNLSKICLFDKNHRFLTEHCLIPDSKVNILKNIMMNTTELFQIL